MASKIAFEALKVAVRQDKEGYILTLRIHPNDVPEELLRSWVGSRYGVAMVEIGEGVGASASAPVEPPNSKADNSIIRKAVLLCKETGFWNWIEVKNEAEAKAKLCARLGIESRSELPHNQQAIDKFNIIYRNYLSDCGF